MLHNNQALDVQLINTAQQFRLGKEAEASKRLRTCIDLLESELKKLKDTSAISNIMPLMLAAQERQDWLGLADYLEYELAYILNN